MADESMVDAILTEDELVEINGRYREGFQAVTRVAVGARCYEYMLDRDIHRLVAEIRRLRAIIELGKIVAEPKVETTEWLTT